MEIDNILGLLGAKCEKSNLLAAELLKYVEVQLFINHVQDKNGIYIYGKWIHKFTPESLIKYNNVKIKKIPHFLFSRDFLKLIPVDNQIINKIIDYIYELHYSN